MFKNKDGLPLPTTFTGLPATEYVISSSEQYKRIGGMKTVCNGCNNLDWISGHCEKLARTWKETDAMTLAATNLMQEAWRNGIKKQSKFFDEPIEQLWIKQRLFFANSVRHASTMTGVLHYAVFIMLHSLKQITEVFCIEWRGSAISRQYRRRMQLDRDGS